MPVPTTDNPDQRPVEARSTITQLLQHHHTCSLRNRSRAASHKKSWLWTCAFVQGFGRNMDIMKSKATVTSGLFGLVTPKLEDAHGVSIIGQGNLTYLGRQAVINELRTAQDEIAILLSAFELL